MPHHDSPMETQDIAQPALLPKVATSQSPEIDISPYNPKAAASHLEKICAGFMYAINNRELYPECPAWADHCASNFQADHDCPVRKKKFVMDLDEWLRTKRDMIAGDCKDYRIEVPEQNTTIYQKEGTAEVFTVIKSHGLIEGVVAQDIGVFQFKYAKGKWTCIKYRGLRGLNDGLSVYGSA